MQQKISRPLNNMEKKALEAATHTGAPGAEPKVIEDRHYRRMLEVEMFQDEHGAWQIRLNQGSPMVATDAEVVLWLKLLASKRARLGAVTLAGPG